MNTCKCDKLKEFRPIESNNPITYQCLNCKAIYIDKYRTVYPEEIVGLEHTDNPFKSYVRVP